MLQISQETVAAIIAHGHREIPNEACGYLAADADGVIRRHLELHNLDQAPDHFTMDPAEQFAAIRRIREEGRQLIAVYHSHPESPARPSEEDIRLAHDPAMLYLIVSLLPVASQVRVFRINQGEVREEELVIVA
ncbi:MAG: hypothetical protein A2505_08780 [Deltaproteobacteria bacterium RIFOXYD12_FULL_55_16]|nr:MAG: hypothetical protein A2505_08780 [Deltaproteobacteria bacterium RIFOXYD12_FULL_55_16]